ncbi:MAG TPA: ergothioneine biosynthesis protein EgtB [Burkholderiaceae bacterium]|nr:ergothioneine biosynthesis protein EgtB [Burkholderiaceae bacterium]
MDASGRPAAARDLERLYRRVRNQSMMLVEGLTPEDCMVQSMVEASPVKWHLAHVTWFFETLVLETWLPRFGLQFRAFSPAYRLLFNSYYVGVGPRQPRAERGALSRPSLKEVFAYRAAIDEQMIALMRLADAEPALSRLITLGINHEQQHQELILTDLKHHFSRNPLLPAFVESRQGQHTSPSLLNRFVEFPGGKDQIGHAGDSFAFDNECPRHSVWIEPFEMATRPVTNAEYMEFVKDGGYRRADLWLSDGWDTVCRERWDAPLYWLEDGGVFTLAGRQALDPDEPVCHISYYEADAFAHWAKARLPSESEWEHVAQSVTGDEDTAGAQVRPNFLESGLLHPRAAATQEQAGSGMVQLFGDVWEWTQSAYLPYPGFEPSEGAVGEYNGKFMVNQLVLRGGSCATPADHIRASYRNFFYPQARWQFSGIRLARDLR